MSENRDNEMIVLPALVLTVVSNRETRQRENTFLAETTRELALTGGAVTFRPYP
jgi:hypothetical protein